MNNLLCKSMLIIAIILAIIALVTPNWGKESVLGMTQTGHIGLFSACTTDQSGYRICTSANLDSKIILARNLIMLSILLLIVALVMNFMSEKNPDNKQVKIIGMGCYILGLICMIVGIGSFSADLPPNMFGIKYSYDFSYYLAIVSVVLTLCAGICNLVHKNK